MNEGENMECMKVVEMEWDNGGRFWSPPMPESKVAAFIDAFPPDLFVSDIDCAPTCPHIQAIRFNVDGEYFECSHGHARCSRHLPTVRPL